MYAKSAGPLGRAVATERVYVPRARSTDRHNSRSCVPSCFQHKTKDVNPSHAISIGCVQVSSRCHAAAIIVITSSGFSAKIVARYRPECPVLAIVRHGKCARKLCVWRNLTSVHYVGKYARRDNWPFFGFCWFQSTGYLFRTRGRVADPRVQRDRTDFVSMFVVRYWIVRGTFVFVNRFARNECILLIFKRRPMPFSSTRNRNERTNVLFQYSVYE